MVRVVWYRIGEKASPRGGQASPPRGGPPGVFIQDADAAMTQAAERVFPLATKRRCLWHLGQNLIKNLKPTLGSDFKVSQTCASYNGGWRVTSLGVLFCNKRWRRANCCGPLRVFWHRSRPIGVVGIACVMLPLFVLTFCSLHQMSEISCFTCRIGPSLTPVFSSLRRATNPLFHSTNPHRHSSTSSTRCKGDSARRDSRTNTRS